MYEYPFGNGQQLNLDWFLAEWKNLLAAWEAEKNGIAGALDAEIAKAEAALADVFAARDAAAQSAANALESKNAAAQSASDASGYLATVQADTNSARNAAQNAAQSESNAADSAQTAVASKNAAGQSERNAAQSEANANSSKNAAAQSASDADASKSAAAQSAADADASKRAAADSASAAAQSADIARNAVDDKAVSLLAVLCNNKYETSYNLRDIVLKNNKVSFSGRGSNLTPVVVNITGTPEARPIISSINFGEGNIKETDFISTNSLKVAGLQTLLKAFTITGAMASVNNCIIALKNTADSPDNATIVRNSPWGTSSRIAYINLTQYLNQYEQIAIYAYSANAAAVNSAELVIEEFFNLPTSATLTNATLKNERENIEVIERDEMLTTG